jgi:hypothetical protein
MHIWRKNTLQRTESQKKAESLSTKEIKRLLKAKFEKRISSLPHGFWRCESGKEHSKIAIKYLIEEHLQLKLQEVPKKVNAQTFHEAGLFRVLVEFFDCSYYKALDYAYPDRFKPWDFPKGMTGIWEGEKGRKRSLIAIAEIIERMELTEEEIPDKINYNIFRKNGLGGMLQTLYNSSPFEAIDALYPGKYKPWEFHVKNFWKNESIETARKAIRWLVEEKLGFSEKELIMVRRKHFLQHSLGQLLKYFYKNSHILALQDVYG